MQKITPTPQPETICGEGNSPAIIGYVFASVSGAIVGYIIGLFC